MVHSQHYLEQLFADQPILVEICPFKERKSKVDRTVINIKIEYKEMECDMQYLSGGEKARVILAFTLALSEMFNTPLLLLDESTANLDQQSSMKVI